MDDAGEPRSGGRPERGWTAVAISTAVSVPVALFLAFAGWLWTPAVAGGEPHPEQGTTLWALSAVILVGAFGAVPGPARARRLVAALVAGTVWFLVGRFVLSAV